MKDSAMVIENTSFDVNIGIYKYILNNVNPSQVSNFVPVLKEFIVGSMKLYISNNSNFINLIQNLYKIYVRTEPNNSTNIFWFFKIPNGRQYSMYMLANDESQI